ncbi:hypothetical protein MBMB1_1252 [Methanobacterium sp. MB1]|jgi:GT2 family glycosyltransferase|uniref:glycosyltransferase family 2 protein n=1 Tax=Methanobacterium sp. TaxID=2164 RepID=UPI0003C9B8A7|nr:glycosyltransferase [uncultured Methanobacterium sp.]CDG65351.1 hypothetical protein MBMB1_1252 [Methanobacterium sp. MB1]
MDSKVSIVILNWNGWEETLQCLNSISKIYYSNFDVLIVDNASNDDSVAQIKDYYQIM